MSPALELLKIRAGLVADVIVLVQQIGDVDNQLGLLTQVMEAGPRHAIDSEVGRQDDRIVDALAGEKPSPEESHG